MQHAKVGLVPRSPFHEGGKGARIAIQRQSFGSASISVCFLVATACRPLLGALGGRSILMTTQQGSGVPLCAVPAVWHAFLFAVTP